MMVPIGQEWFSVDVVRGLVQHGPDAVLFQVDLDHSIIYLSDQVPVVLRAEILAVAINEVWKIRAVPLVSLTIVDVPLS